MSAVQLAQIPATKFLYDKEITTLVLGTVVTSCFWQFICLFLVHITMTQVGLKFVESETLRVGNEGILNNLNEGVVILQDKSYKVLFANKAAEKQFDVKVN